LEKIMKSPVDKPADELAENEDLMFDRAARDVINLGNQLMEDNPDADEWEVASGVLAGAVQFWLFSRQPCDDPMCESCAEVNTAAQRLGQLLGEVNDFAAESDYFHSPTDTNVGTA
jgi:hypothetical protein